MRLLSALLISIRLLGAADLPSAESLLDKSLERSGGKAYRELSSVQLTGTVDMQGHNITGPISILQKGSKSYTSIDLPGLGKVEEGFDGETAWEMNALQGARVKTSEEKAALERTEKLNMLSTWHEFYSSARTLSSEIVNGKPAWKLELIPKTGKPEYFYLDKGTSLLARTTQTVSTPLGEITVDTTVGDYKVVDGIQTALSMTQNAMGQIMQMHFDQVKYNLPLADERFVLPAAVQAIVAKHKAQQ